jgi:hypothetical protein
MEGSNFSRKYGTWVKVSNGNLHEIKNLQRKIFYKIERRLGGEKDTDQEKRRVNRRVPQQSAE